ncbi:MAG TPA: TetR/AcrR family transcriptional regulator [Stellaceae bacterium]
MPLDDNAPWRLTRRRRILAAAAQLFAEKPFNAVQVDEVAKSAGIGKATLYRYFPSKDELYLEVLGEALHGLERRFAEIAAAPEPPSAALERMIRTLVHVLGEQVASLRLLDGENAALAGRWRSVYRSRRQAIIDSLRAVLARGLAAGAFRNVDLDVTPAFLIGMIRGGLMGVAHLPHDRLADAAVALVVQGGLVEQPATAAPPTAAAADRPAVTSS